jgi:hypothetical protein
MSLAYIGTSGRDVAVPVSFSIHASKLYKQCQCRFPSTCLSFTSKLNGSCD